MREKLEVVTTRWQNCMWPMTVVGGGGRGLVVVGQEGRRQRHNDTSSCTLLNVVIDMKIFVPRFGSPSICIPTHAAN